jgi:uncharacterized LabA/DUF88 family protein
VENLAFIDGQNLHLGTLKEGWKVDLHKLRIYLREKYHIDRCFYFLGCYLESEADLYANLSQCNYTLIFKDHKQDFLGKKKGNVDSDLIFEAMKSLIEMPDIGKIILISGDGDYFKLIKYLFDKNKFLRILFPNRKFASSLYKSLGSEHYDYLSNIRSYIEHDTNKKGS